MVGGTPIPPEPKPILVRVYLIPMLTLNNNRYPKYMPGRINPDPLPELAGVYSAWYPFGAEPLFIVAATITDEQHAYLAANSDVTSAPRDLDEIVTDAALSVLQTRLESYKIPADWIVANETSYRELIRLVYRFFEIVHRFYGITNGGNLFAGAVNLSTTWAELSQVAKDTLLQIAAEWEFDTGGLTGASTVRQILKAVANQMADVPVNFGRLEI